MRVLAITNLYPRPDLPGLGIFNHQMLDALSRLTDIRVICLVPQWRFWRWSQIRRWSNPRSVSWGVAYLPVPYVPGIGRGLSAWFYRRVLEKAVTVAEDEAVYAAWLYPDAVAVAEWARRRKKPVWVRIMGSDLFHLRAADRLRQIRRADGVIRGYICNSRRQMAVLEAAGLGAGRLHYVPNGVDARLFYYREQQAAARELAGIPPAGGRRRILFAGNLVPVKAPDLALRALVEVVKTYEPAELVLVGDGPLQSRLEKLARTLNLMGRVYFAGRRKHDEMPFWMNACDVLCLSSRSEGMPNVILEALASGLPVVATDVGACRDLLEGEPLARLVPPDDPRKLGEALADLLSRPADRAELAERHGRRSWANQAQEVFALMRKVIPAQ